jgi:hypothetical protein
MRGIMHTAKAWGVACVALCTLLTALQGVLCCRTMPAAVPWLCDCGDCSSTQLGPLMKACRCATPATALCHCSAGDIAAMLSRQCAAAAAVLSTSALCCPHRVLLLAAVSLLMCCIHQGVLENCTHVFCMHSMKNTAG